MSYSDCLVLEHVGNTIWLTRFSGIKKRFERAECLQIGMSLYLQEVNQLDWLLHELRCDIIAASYKVMAIEVTGENNARRFPVFLVNSSDCVPDGIQG